MTDGGRRIAGPFYREYAPAADLRSHVACTWVKVVGPRPRPIPSAIIPNGCVDLVVIGAAPPHVAGPASVTQWVAPLPPGTVVTGIRFRPGAARTLLRIPAAELRDRDALLVDIDGRGANAALLGALVAAQDPAVRRRALERWARERIGRASADDLLLVAAAASLTRDPRLSVAGLAADLGWGERRLHRAFLATCGYGPKTLQRIMRLQRALAAARLADLPAALSDVALAAGYADQAHMTRDFGAITGFTPAAYLATADLEVGRWLDNAW